ncbi:MAG: hypothetical protein ACREA0_29035 [bacterium]
MRQQDTLRKLPSTNYTKTDNAPPVCTGYFVAGWRKGNARRLFLSGIILQEDSDHGLVRLAQESVVGVLRLLDRESVSNEVVSAYAAAGNQI